MNLSRAKILLTSLLLLVLAAIPRQADAKRTPVPRIYMFGFAASLNDSIVHFTDIQPVDSAWIETRNGFLLGRENYSYQLRDYIAHNLGLPHRTCIVVYAMKKEKLEKKFIKLRQRYTKVSRKIPACDVRYIGSADFTFQPIDMSVEESAPEETKK